MLEQRKSPRSPTDAPRPLCELRIGTTAWTASLVDESDDGFGILVRDVPNLRRGQKAQLRTGAGWFAVRVAHIARIAPVGVRGATAAKPASQRDADVIVLNIEDTADAAAPDSPHEKDPTVMVSNEPGRSVATERRTYLRLGLRRLERIAPADLPADSLPVVCEGLGPGQLVRNLLSSVLPR
jgi:hypothetical protein